MTETMTKTMTETIILIQFQCPKCKALQTNAVLKKTGYHCAQCGYKKKRQWASFKSGGVVA